jgi:hypothetical protein
MYKSLLILIIFNSVKSLIPHHLPSGQLIKFKPNLNAPRSDLIFLEPKKASIVTTNWMTNIMHHRSNEVIKKEDINDFKNRDILNYDHLNVVAEITTLLNKECNLQDDKLNSSKSLLLGWYPMGNHGRNEILFIIYCKINSDLKQLNILQLIQSPFWSPNSIESSYLKWSLEDLCRSIDNYSLNLEQIYVKDLRYKLAWSTWNLDSEEIDFCNNFPEEGEVSWDF